MPEKHPRRPGRSEGLEGPKDWHAPKKNTSIAAPVNHQQSTQAQHNIVIEETSSATAPEMSSTRPTRRNTTATVQRRLEEIERNRRNNRDGSTTGRGVGERQEEGGQREPGGGDNGNVASRDEMEALRAENRRLRHLTGELQLNGEGQEGFSGYSAGDGLVETFLDFEKHAKVSSAGKAVSEPGFKKLVGVTNYEGWKKSFQTMAEIHNLWEMYEGMFDALATTTDQKVSVKFRRLSRNAMGILHTACDGTIGSSLQSEGIELPSQAMILLSERNRQRGSAIVWSLFREFFNTTLASTGSVTEFRNKLVEVQEKLMAVDTGYRLPAWQVNSHFLTALTSAFDNKVAVLSSDESIVSVTDPKDFQTLAREVIQEEQRQMNNDDGIVLAVQGQKRCTFCRKIGHLAIAGPEGCYRMSQNARYRPRWYTEQLEKKGRKRSGTEAAYMENATKRSRIEESDFVQGSTSD